MAKQKQKRKRKLKPILDDKQRTKACKSLALGVSRETTARYVGCSIYTFRRTLRRLPDFRLAVEQAETQHEIGLLQRMHTELNKKFDWRLVTWLLERHYPNRYVRRKPDQLTRHEMIDWIQRLWEVLMAEVADPEQRRQIAEAIQKVGSQLRSDALWLADLDDKPAYPTTITVTAESPATASP